MLYKRKARAAVQDAGPLSPKSQRRQDEFDEMRILLLQNQLLLSKDKEETKKEEKDGEDDEEKKKEGEVTADAQHDVEENATNQNDEEGQTMSGSILLL